MGRAAFSLELSAINQACLPSPGVHKHAHKIGFFFFFQQVVVCPWEEKKVKLAYSILETCPLCPTGRSVYSYLTVV